MSLSVWKESLTEFEPESLTILMVLVLLLPVPVSPVVSMLSWPRLSQWIILLQLPSYLVPGTSYLLVLVLQTTCLPSNPLLSPPPLVLLLLVGDSLRCLRRLRLMMNTMARTRIRSRNIRDRITPAIIPAVSAELSWKIMVLQQSRNVSLINKK